MKATTFLLAASLLGNAALAILIVTRKDTSVSTTTASSFAPTAANAAAEKNADALRAALVSGDAAALAAAGVPSDIARELMIGRTFARMAEKLRATRAKPDSDDEWWRGRPGATSPGSREQQLIARRELSDALIAAFGDDLGLAGPDTSDFAFLPAAKRDALRRINQDYDEMMAKFSGSGGVQLPSDREKLRLLRAERDRDVAALLTPEERLAYEMRTSLSGNTVRGRYGDAIESEAEFQKIYSLQKAFDEHYSREALSGRVSPELLRARAEAERQLAADIRASVGEERFAALRRAADPDVRTLDTLASRLNLPPTTTDAVLGSRDTYSAASQRIVNDEALSMPERRTQIQALAEQAKSELTRTLGAEGAEAYAQRSPWVNMLQGGMAYSTTPPPGTPTSILPGGRSVFPVMPARAPGGGTTSQVVIGSPTTDQVVFGEPAVGGDVRVITFTPGRAEVPPNGGRGAVIRQGIVTPAPSSTPPAATNPATPSPGP